jgi:phage tail tape-measure protein
MTDAPGAHPIGTGIGGAVGGAIAGAAVGAIAGPLGAAIGVAVGAVAGGLARKALAENENPTIPVVGSKDLEDSQSHGSSIIESSWTDVDFPASNSFLPEIGSRLVKVIKEVV